MSDQSSAIPYIGSKISLISNAEIRYEGILHTLNTQASNISLQSVRCFGTEGRKEPEIPPTNEVYDFIIFRGRDIKDLTVLSGSHAAQSLQMNDPAIMSVNQRPAGGKGAKGSAPKGPTERTPEDEARGVLPDRRGYGKSKSGKGAGGDGAKGASKGGDKGGAKGSGKGAKGTAKGADSGKGGKASKGKDEGEKGGKAGKAKGGSSAADGGTAKGGAKGSKDSGKGSKDSKGKDGDAKGKSKGASGEARAKGNGRSSGRRGRGSGDDTLESDDINGDSKDFDYAAASARFEKSRSEDGNSAPKSGYDKSKSFFDNISGEAGARASDADRSKADRDSETFGDGEAARPAGGRHRKGARRGGAPRGSKA
mmetsp:Transcript_47854/g.84243  ORF Transcript_47854/g.84243 Transcript_47854/m.84243 type:complete len:367 (-) Transcript_47854:101-1201(-)